MSLEYTEWHHVVYLQSKYTQESIINVIMTASNYCLTNIEIDCPGRQKKQLFIFRKHTTSDLQLVLGVFSIVGYDFMFYTDINSRLLKKKEQAKTVFQRLLF